MLNTQAALYQLLNVEWDLILNALIDLTIIPTIALAVNAYSTCKTMNIFLK